MPFTPLDWLLSVFLLYSVVRAGMRGLFLEAFSLAGLVLGFPLACWYQHTVARKLAGLMINPALTSIAAFLLILAAVVCAASLLGRFFRRGARTVGLGFADRLGGALFGLGRGAALSAACLFAITAWLPVGPWVQGSVLAPPLLRGAHAVSFTMPPDLRFRLNGALGHFKHTSPDWIKLQSSAHTESRTLHLSEDGLRGR